MSIINPSPTVSINGFDSTNGVDVLQGSTVTIQLLDSAGVNVWQVRCLYTDEYHDADTITGLLSFDYVTKTATFTMPSDGYDFGCALLFESVVNQGMDVNGNVIEAYTSHFGVYTKYGNSLRISALNETIEGSNDFGWVTKFNNAIRALGSSGVSFSAGGDLSGTALNQTVEKIHGATVPVAGALTTGNVLQVAGVSTLAYAPVNLAGGANYVTGALPTANQVVQPMGGDVSGTTAAATVAKINATTVSTAGGALTTGKVLRVTGAATSDWGAVDLANSSAVTGLLPTANQVVQDMLGDVTGTTAASVLTKLRGKLLATGLATVGATEDGYALTWDNGLGAWRAEAPSVVLLGDVTGPTSATVVNMGGDITGTSGNASVQVFGDVTGPVSGTTVAKLRGKSLAASLGTLGPSQNGYVLTWVDGSSEWQVAAQTGGTATTWADDLAGSTITSQKVVAITGVGGTSVNLGSGAAAFTLGMVDKVINGGSGAQLTVRAQNETGTTSNGGALALYSGSGTSQHGAVYIGTGDGTGQFIFIDGSNPAVGTGIRFSNFTNAYASYGLITVDNSGNLGQTNYTSLVLSGGDVSGTLGGATVEKVKGTTITTAGGSLATGAVLRVTGGSTADWGALDLADTDAVTGVLPTANQAVQTLTGDASGTTAAVVVDQARGLKSATTTVSVSAATAPSAGQVLTATSSTVANWQSPTGGITTVASIDTSPNANGLFISGNNISTQLASASQPGMVSTGTQTLAGNKTLSGATTLSALGLGIVHSSSGGALTSSLLVDADVSSSAAIAVSKLAAGTNTYVLTTVAGVPTWAVASGGGITALTGDVTASGTGSVAATHKTSQATATATKTGSYTITTSDYQIFANPSGAFNLTLPAPANGMVYHVWDISGTMETNNVTLVRNGSEKISGVAASRVLSTNWGHWMITTDGTDWYVG